MKNLLIAGRDAPALVSGMSGILASGRAPNIVHMSAYANTLTAIIPTLFAALDVVSREMVGFIPSASRAASVERAAVGQSVPFPIAPAQTAYDIAPAMTVPEPPDNTFTTGTMTITKARAVPFGFTGEEQRALNSNPGAGVGYLDAQGMLFAQALRTLCNEMEADLAAEATANASRATGTAGTTPFGSTLGDSAQLRKILDDNGAPMTGRSLVISTATGANLRTLTQLTKANEAGTQMTLRQGELLDIHGFSFKESGQAVSKVKGTGASATTDTAGYAVGAKVINLAATGTGTITKGDVITFAGDTNKYVVATGNANVGAGGSITLAEPGLRVAIPASATAITVGNSFVGNVGFSDNALAIAMRLPALPQEGDLAIDRMTLTDPRSGVTYEVAVYAGYRKIRAEVCLAWGVKATKREHIALLLG